ncbi:MAG: prophage LambdaCh01, site-specific recombinase, phage integrase family [Lachnospiraceae bacterium]|jgi:integrase|nr:prophage LambdaCh01, site-specific recombinase, phage integrase family [Lachnospiraceae bacterium]
MKIYTYQIKSGPNKDRWAGYILIKGENGQRDLKPTKYGKTEKEVLIKLAELEREIENGEYIPRNTDTFIGFLKEYHKICAGYDMWKGKPRKNEKAKWQETTSELYKLYIDVHFEKYFSSMKVVDIKPMTLDKFYNQKLSETKMIYKKIDGVKQKVEVHKMSINTAIKLNKFLKSAFNYAIDNGMVKQNPADKVILGKKTKYEPVIYDNEQFLKLLDYTKKKYDRIPIVLGAGMGFRRGEIFGLTWEDIDFDKQTISVNKTNVRFKKNMIKSPKNETSNRIITGPSYVFKTLKEYKEEVKPVNEKEFILSVTPAYYSHRFNWLLEKFDLPTIRLHDLRHFNAVIMMNNGIPDKVAADRLGHATVTTLRTTYQHVLMEMDKKAADKINDVFEPKKKVTEENN